MLVAGTIVLVRDAAPGIEVLLIRRPDRSSFAGAWVFPGGIIEDTDRRVHATEVEDAARAAVRETTEEVGLHTTGLVTLSQWTPPTEAPKRVRTWFFLASDVQGEITPSPDEVADWRWVRPVDALAAHSNREIELFPPTWVTLHGLVDAADTAGALAAASEPLFYATHILAGLEAQTFIWQGDTEHPLGGAARHRLETDGRPWRYLRD